MTFSGRGRATGRCCLGACVGILAASVVLVLGPATHSQGSASAAGRSCRSLCGHRCINECRSEHRDCIDSCTEDFGQGLDPQQCGSCVQDAFDSWLECHDAVQGADGAVQTCMAGCPAIARHCTVTKECIADCRGKAPGLLAACKQRLKRQLRDCPNGLACLRDARLARRVCIVDCRGNATDCIGGCRQDFSECVATCSAAVTAEAAGGCNCQGRCVRDIVPSCYADCADACGEPGLALDLCQRGCRNQACDNLDRACTGDGTGHSEYDRCCAQCDNCEDALADEFACEQATTTTRAPTTTTATTTSTTMLGATTTTTTMF
jgi:hypothetical protein